MDKSAFAIINLILSIIYCGLAIVAIVGGLLIPGIYSFNYDLGEVVYAIGAMIGLLVMVFLPLLFVPANLILSIIGMIKSKKVLPYLVCIGVSIILWGITVSVYVPFMRT